MAKRLVTGDTLDLFECSQINATKHMTEAVAEIDKLLGKGFAKKNPLLIAQFMTTCTAEFNNALLIRTVEEALETFRQNS